MLKFTISLLYLLLFIYLVNCLNTNNPVVFNSQSSYLSYLESIAQLPNGFSIATTRFQFKPYEVDKILPMNLTVILVDKPTSSFASMLTSNVFPGGPIYVNKDRIKNSSKLQAVVINNKISNVCPGGVNDFGRSDSESICDAIANQYALTNKDLVFPSSTGIIGWRLPVPSIVNAIKSLTKVDFQSKSILPAAKSITTTDRYPKIRSYTSKNKKWSISAIAKGAGMIEPNMATMLCYILTDLNVDRKTLQDCLYNAVDKSFNAITVDGDQSTSDTVLLLSSQVIEPTNDDLEEFKQQLSEICVSLSSDIVRNGEGTNHVMKLTIYSQLDNKTNKDLGRFILNSNLFKCAIAGNDPNVGRIIAAIGSYLGKQNLAKATENGLIVKLGNIPIFKDGSFLLDPETEKVLSDYLLDKQLYQPTLKEEDRNYPSHFRTVDIDLIIGNENDSINYNKVTLYGSDLTSEYVEINADYRS